MACKLRNVSLVLPLACVRPSVTVLQSARFSESAICQSRGSVQQIVSEECKLIESSKFSGAVRNPRLTTHFNAANNSSGPIWTDTELKSVTLSQHVPENTKDKVARGVANSWIWLVDKISGYHKPENYTDVQAIWLAKLYISEFCLPNAGLIGGMVQHTKSVFKQPNELGTVSRYLEEADNQRAAFMTILELRKPNVLVKVLTVLVQTVDMAFNVVIQVPAPRFCNRVMGYLYEDLVAVYTRALREIEDGDLKYLKNEPAPDIAVQYWRLAKGAKVSDAILAIRADKNHQLIVNHTLASLAN